MNTPDDWRRLYSVLAAAQLPAPVLDLPHPDHGTTPNKANGKQRVMPIAWPDIKVGIGWDYTDPKAWERSDWTLVALTAATARDLPRTLEFIVGLITQHRTVQQAPADGLVTVPSEQVPGIDEWKPDDWEKLYRVLNAVQLPPPNFGVATASAPDNPLPFAWPAHRLGIALDLTDPTPWQQDGWHIERITSHTARMLSPGFTFLDNVLFAHLLRGSEAAAGQSVSKTERRVLEPLLRAGLSDPDRNHEVRHDDGYLLTVPDFVWHDIRLAVMVDGHMFHTEGGELLRALSGAGKNQKKLLKERVKSKASKDAEARTWMQARGWTVLVIGDGTVDEGGPKFDEAIAGIIATYRRLQAAQAI